MSVYSRILVTGGSGMVGKSLRKILPNAEYISSTMYDLTKEPDVVRMYEVYQPAAVIHLAARVGGIMDNINKPAEYFDDNIIMNTLVVRHAHQHGVKRFIGILSTCIYPDNILRYPITEDVLHDGPPAVTNFSYGYAKRSLAVQIDAYNNQYGTNYQYLIPCNLYGEFDKYGDNSHFIAALIKKIHLAKVNNHDSITLFGDGTPLRQFMHSDDLARVIADCLNHDIVANMNVAVEDNLSIREMTDIVKTAMGATHLTVRFDTTKPNGQLRKDVSINLLKTHIPTFSPIKLEEGVRSTYQYLLTNNIL
jgi:GDP-L-fucose synthase